MTKSMLVGFARKSKSGKSLKVNVSKDAFESAEGYTNSKGEEFVTMIINMDGLLDLLSEKRDFLPVKNLQSEDTSEDAVEE